MASFNDWLTVTDPKLFAETLAEQFRLSQNELQKAQEALAPAFALGLERAMASPADWSRLSGAFAAMVPGAAAKAPTTEPGQAFMQTVFGSDALTAAVARQASLFAGIAPDTMQKLMPSLAMLSMETMVRAAMANLERHQPKGLASGDFGAATAEMMRRGANAVEALSRPSDAPGRRRAETLPEGFSPTYFADAFAQALKSGLGWMQPASQMPAPPPPQAPSAPAAEAFNPMMPFAAMFDAFSKGMQTALEEKAEDAAPAKDPVRAPDTAAASPPPRESPDPEPGPQEPAASGAPSVARAGDSLVDEMMRSGQKFQEDYAREMASLFERYQGPAKAI